MLYKTVTIGATPNLGYEMDELITKALEALSEKANGPVELVNIVPVTVPGSSSACLIILAKPIPQEDCFSMSSVLNRLRTSKSIPIE